MAESGNAEAMFKMGCRHVRGEGVAFSREAACGWWMRAFEEGEHVESAFRLGVACVDPTRLHTNLVGPIARSPLPPKGITNAVVWSGTTARQRGFLVLRPPAVM